MSDDLARAAAEHNRVANAREDAAWIVAFWSGLTGAGMPEDHAFEITSQWLASYVELAAAEHEDVEVECDVDE
jgi:hypothetical protein